MSVQWRHITDLPENWNNLVDQGLKSLAEVWNEQSDKLTSSSAVRDFNTRLCREWAIETGIIESLYTLDRGITQVLIAQGIETGLIPHDASNKSPEALVAILRDQHEALDGLFDFVSRKRELSASYIKELHCVFTRHQTITTAITPEGQYIDLPLLRGDWKKQPNNPRRPGQNAGIHEYCPPEHVASEIDQLIAWHKAHDQAAIPPEVQAAWLHHRFTQIHPFQDGNGRVARALATLIFIRARWFPLVIHRDNREAYIHALEQADQGDLSGLIRLFVKIQKKAFVKALSIAENILQKREPVNQILLAVEERLAARTEKQYKNWEKVFEISSTLKAKAIKDLQDISNKVDAIIKKVNADYNVLVDESKPINDYWFKREIIEVAKNLDYFADTRTFSSWARLKIREDRQVEILISFHALGFDFSGLMAASAFIHYKDTGENSDAIFEGPYVLCPDIFEFSYKENPESVEERFQPWLQEVLLTGLDHWRRQL